jgi:hypothetical protein
MIAALSYKYNNSGMLQYVMIFYYIRVLLLCLCMQYYSYVALPVEEAEAPPGHSFFEQGQFVTVAGMIFSTFKQRDPHPGRAAWQKQEGTGLLAV